VRLFAKTRDYLSRHLIKIRYYISLVRLLYILRRIACCRALLACLPKCALQAEFLPVLSRQHLELHTGRTNQSNCTSDVQLLWFSVSGEIIASFKRNTRRRVSPTNLAALRLLPAIASGQSVSPDDSKTPFEKASRHEVALVWQLDEKVGVNQQRIDRGVDRASGGSYYWPGGATGYAKCDRCDFPQQSRSRNRSGEPAARNRVSRAVARSFFWAFHFCSYTS